MTRKVPTVYDVAALAGVSIATVSRVFRRPDQVTQATKDVVQTAVRDLGYVPSGSARGLAARRAGAIGLCFPDFDGIDELRPVRFTTGPVPVLPDPAGDFEPTGDLYISEVMRGTEIEAWRHGLAVTIAVARGTGRTEIFDNLAGRVDGMVTLSRTVPDDLLAHIARRIPVVVIAGPRTDDDYDHVTTDNAAGMRAMTEHVITAHGITDLAFIGGPPDSPDAKHRFDGHREALRAAGLRVPRGPRKRGDFTRSGGRAIGRALLADGDLPRALICANDQTALGILDVLTQAGVRVPQDVALTGFDGIDGTRLSSPRVTTVHQPMLELGRAAVDTLLRRLNDPQQAPESRTLPVEVLLRESCGCLPVASNETDFS
ncbi:MAG TPA: LacI family DNA-binding transcriptional regulator [Cellulomonas sp.]|uniref:LacI family DNA-binding transcriptional regulator n=1 Tax=Cellulomonas sp. TaxID=40001 RepID=UPI002E380E62|nr:LacI family DNA-binding transcriptional regulator [Cellulomonas sp.]HEX5332958.1 LacI family DNA-binding transcriptional regulator [Cellulomonas sp.]